MIPTSSSKPMGPSVRDGVRLMIHERFISWEQECVILPPGGGQLSVSLAKRKMKSKSKGINQGLAEAPAAPCLFHQPDQWMAVALKLQPEMLRD